MKAKELWELANDLFQKRAALMSLWQEIAENFYVERADFTYNRSLGTEFAAGLMTNFPMLCRRDLGDQLGTMLRPTSQAWFHIVPANASAEDNDSKQWLERAAIIQRSAMYDRVTQFHRATKEADHDYATFGQTVISLELNYRRAALLYRCHHLRDVVWTESEEGPVNCVFRKWKPQLRELKRLYPATIHPTADQMASKKPFETVECSHMVVEAEMYDGEFTGQQPAEHPRVLICYDQTHDRLLEAVPIWGRHYIVPRWQTVSGSQYAYSPATVAALPDARLIQAMTLTLLEAGEKITNPPMIATQEAVRSDIQVFPGGLTWVDIEYDERFGEALRPLTTDAKGMPIGIDMQRDSRQLIHQAFFLNKLALPQRAPEMTAYEVGQRIQQFIRDALPIFEPMEIEYNGGLCDETFELLRRAGAFGNPRDMPEALQGAEVQFRFESPLHEAIEQRQGQKFLEMKGLLAEAIALDPGAAYVPKVIDALRDALRGIGVPARWQHSEDEVTAQIRRAAERQEAEALLARMAAGAVAAKDLAAANKDNAAAAAPLPAVP